MSDTLYQARKEHRDLVARLREAFPDASDADLADTIEGESRLEDAIAGALRAAQEADAMADGVGAYIEKLSARKTLWEVRAAKLREMALNAAQEADIKKVPVADFTASVVVGKRKVVITGTVPETFSKAKWSPDKGKIEDALNAGVKLPFAQLSNAEPHWVVRYK